MSYGIKIINVVTEDGRPQTTEYWLKTLSEYTEGNVSKPIAFESIEDAEVYAQNHELHSFQIKELLNNQ